MSITSPKWCCRTASIGSAQDYPGAAVSACIIEKMNWRNLDIEVAERIAIQAHQLSRAVQSALARR